MCGAWKTHREGSPFTCQYLGAACVGLAAQTDLHRDAPAQVLPPGTTDPPIARVPVAEHNREARHTACLGQLAADEQLAAAWLSILAQAPEDNPEAVPHSHFETTAIQATIRPFGDADEGGDTGICRCHHCKQSLDLVDTLNELRPRKHIPPAQPNSHWLTVL
jgi:hypothetical protein